MADTKSSLSDYSLFNMLLEGVQIISRDWKYLYVNEPILVQGKKSWEELLGKTMMEAYPGIDQTPLFTTVRAVMETRQPEKLLNEFTYPDSSRGWFQLSVNPWEDGIIILSMDVTAAKKAGAL
jgi:hypothetical protein